MKKRYLLALIIVIILGVYYPTIYGELCSVDDQSLVTYLINKQAWNTHNLFFRHSLYYYRPLTALTFHVDRFLFFCQPEIMHMENILIHLCNVLLLFLLVSHILKNQNKDEKYPFHFVSALVVIFFGIHPLTTEPVNWVSGRTDLLAGLFCLLSFTFFLLPGRKSTWWTDTIAAFFFLLGLLSKEVAVSLLPLVILAVMWSDLSTYRKTWTSRLKRIAPYILFFSFYVWMRTGFQFSYDSGVKSAIKGAHDAVALPFWSKLGSLIKALGFYLKKIVWPFPLNFAIVEINRPFCFSLGILTVIVSLYMLCRRKSQLLYFLFWPILFVAPALLVAVNKMAWTPLAERYLYIPLVGIAIALGIILARYARYVMILPFILILFIFGGITAKRNIIWQKNITLFADTVRKSPNFPSAHNEYATALFYEGKLEEAKKEYKLAAQLRGKCAAEIVSKTNLAGIENSTEIENLLSDILKNGKDRKVKVRLLKKLARDVNQKTLKCSNSNRRKVLVHQNILILEELRKLDKNPYISYRLGQLYLAEGKKEKACEAFGLACSKSNSFYTRPACKLHQKLSQELGKNE